MVYNDLQTKSKEFAQQIILVCRDIKSEFHETTLSEQLLRIGISIDDSLHVAQNARDLAEFIDRIEEALAACDDIERWLELMADLGYLPQDTCRALLSDRAILRNMLTDLLKRR